MQQEENFETIAHEDYETIVQRNYLAVVERMRVRFQHFESGELPHSSDMTVRQLINEDMKLAAEWAPEGQKVDMALLDPAGQSTAAQIEERFMQAAIRNSLRAASLTQAVAAYQQLVVGCDPDMAPALGEDISRHLGKAQRGPESLDPTGMSSREQMEEQLEALQIKYQLMGQPVINARQAMSDLLDYREPPKVREQLLDIYEGFRARSSNISLLPRSAREAAPGQELYDQVFQPLNALFRSGNGFMYELIGPERLQGVDDPMKKIQQDFSHAAQGNMAIADMLHQVNAPPSQNQQASGAIRPIRWRPDTPGLQ